MLEYELTEEGSEFIREDLCQRLKEGQVGIVPTETVYGLICLAGHDDAREKICTLKARDAHRPMQFLVDTIDHFSWLDVEVTPNLRKLAEAFWPGPLTVVVTNTAGEHIGIRVPHNDFLCTLIESLGAPLTATSANVSGEDPDEHLRAGFTNLNGEPDFVVLGPRGQGTASTVIRLHPDGSYDMIREGSITAGQIDSTLKGDNG